MNSLAKNYQGGRNQSHSQAHSNIHQNNLVDQKPSVDNFTTAQKNINAGVLEYLLKYGFMKTVDQFQDELSNQKTSMQKNLVLDENTGINYMINVNSFSFQRNILQAFSLGKREHFFISWNRFVPLQLKQNDVICQKLEFYLHIYFAIFPVHPINPSAGNQQKELQRELNAFKNFLDTKGQELSKTSEFLQFYALPYVTNPLDHPIFKGLCSKKWANDLRNKLKEFLTQNLPKLSSPQLFHWYANFKKRVGGNPKGDLQGLGASPEAEDLKERLLMLQKHYIVLQKKEEYTKQTLIDSQSKWTNFSKEILNISKELLFSLESMGAKFTLNKISLMPIKDKMARFEAFLNNNSDELEKKHGISMNKRSFVEGMQQQQQMMSQNQVMSAGSQQQQYGYQNNNQMALRQQQQQQMNQSFDEEGEPVNRQLNNRFQNQNQGQYQQHPGALLLQQQQQQQQNIGLMNLQDLAPLNFQKIKHFLMTSNDELKICATLQALRWRLTKGKRKSLVKKIIFLYMHFDLLGCSSKENQIDQSYRVLDRLMQCSKRVIEYTMTFINALANESQGRSYLLQKPDLVQVLVNILHSEQQDSSLRQSALGTLQKFSLRKKPQNIMIQLDMIKWVANVLKNQGEQLSDYSIEYATALLMNLSLRSAGKDKIEDPNLKLLNVLSELVEHENIQVRTYVNGTLYSIFTREKLREEAKELGMVEILSYLMDQSDEQFQRQIQYILNQLNPQGNQDNNGNEETESLNPNEQDDEEYDEDDDDDDEEDEEDDMIDEDDGEFNDIIDERGILLGEDLLVNEFIGTQEEQQQQIRSVQMMIEKDRQRRMQQYQQKEGSMVMANASHNNIHSPYSNQTRVTQDGRPLMRPVTPIKSAQAMRQQHSTNTSQITNNKMQESMINMQENYDYGGGGQQILQQDDQEQPDEGRNLPSELKHRPKLPRTPFGNERQQQSMRNLQSNDGGGQDQEASFLPIIKKKNVNVEVTDEEIKEFKEAFISKEKLPRSPPDGSQRQKLPQVKKRIQPQNMGGGQMQQQRNNNGVQQNQFHQ